MRKLLADRSFQLTFILTLLFLETGIALLLLGLANYGWMLFVLLPILLGLALGAMLNKRYTLWGALIATALTLLGLYVPGLSGLLCIVMVLPIIVPLIFLGFVVSHLAARNQQLRERNQLPVLLAPLLLFVVGAPLEQYATRNEAAIIAVTTERVYPYSPEQVYDAIKSVDTLDAPKPFLMNFDLPIPVKCVLEKEAVGGRRTCYFKAGLLSNDDFGAGTITERITALERGRLLQMDVELYNLVGRKWLGFREATYRFEPAGPHGCKMTRLTTYTSVLRPRAYWGPLEKLGIRQEHDYVFDNLARDLRRKFGRR
ncbi:hypothetical protein GCM10022409_20280 [Hymenobacter glaciei]|uniref:Polyketide cyclase n=1 Tax=Hymenobacter glaciei TaxID=877209 RepID=A0ABP7U3K6_9BACT